MFCINKTNHWTLFALDTWGQYNTEIWIYMDNKHSFINTSTTTKI